LSIANSTGGWGSNERFSQVDSRSKKKTRARKGVKKKKKKKAPAPERTGKLAKIKKRVRLGRD